MTERADSLRITEIFYSLQGETSFTGLPTTFIRLTGCPLRCQYCDSEYAFHGGRRMTLSDIMMQVRDYPTRRVTVTGGEPLAQPNCLVLLKQLADEGFQISLETSGALSVADVDPRVVKILDLKTPGSGECERNLWDNIRYLTTDDEVKFVICSRDDFDWAAQVLKNQLSNFGGEILFSPSANQLNPTDLANWILEDKLAVRMQVQLHKILWGDQPGR